MNKSTNKAERLILMDPQPNLCLSQVKCTSGGLWCHWEQGWDEKKMERNAIGNQPDSATGVKKDPNTGLWYWVVGVDNTFPSTHTKFKFGDDVTKPKGSRWSGNVVGWYSTKLTPEGYAVESCWERGSVQIYPAAALEKVT